MVLGMSPHIGGVESYIMNWFRNIDRNKYEFYFPYYKQIAYKEELLALKAILLKLEVTRHNPIKYVHYMNKIFEKYSFDAVYYNTCDIMSMDMIMFGKKQGDPVRIIHSHKSSNIIPPNFLHQITEKWCRKRVDKYATKMLACSQVAGQWMFDGRTFEIVNNGIDVEKFRFNSTARKKMRKILSIEDNLVIGFVGSLWRQKNPIFLIEVFEKILKKREDAILLIVGEGELHKEMEDRVSEYGISHAVRFLGICPNVSELMGAMDRYVLPSIFEGLPFVLVEAQANGLPCITSDNVSRESNITGEVQYASLDETLEFWSDLVLNHQVMEERDKYADIIRNSGFDIVSIVKQIESHLEGN